jgi:hypothetical protein
LLLEAAVMDKAEEVRRQAADEAWTPERIVREVEKVDLFDGAVLATARAAHERVAPGLVAAMQGGGPARHKASLLLLYIGDPRGNQGVMESVGSDQARNMLAHLSVAPHRGRNDDGSPFPLDLVALDQALVPLVENPGSREYELALDLMKRFKTPAAERYVGTLLAHPSPKLRLKAIQWYADQHDVRALEPLGELLAAGKGDSYWLIRALEDYGESSEPAVRARAAQIAATTARPLLGKDDNSTANTVWNLLRVIERAQPPWEAAFLAEVVASNVSWARGCALERLATLEGSAGEARVLAALGDPALRKNAATALAKLESPDPAASHEPLRRALAAELASESPHERTVSELATAMIARGLVRDPSLDRAAPLLDGWDRACVIWVREGIRPSMIAAELVAAGAIDSVPPDRLATLEREWDAKPSPFNVVLTLLQERVVYFDTEAPLVPPDYVKLVTRLDKLTRGALAIECATQEPQAGRGCESELEHIAVAIVDRERVIRYRAEYRGDWFDVSATLAALDGALELAGRPERFFVLETGDQCCCITCAPGDAFESAANRLGIPIERDADASARAGIAYERRVISSLT